MVKGFEGKVPILQSEKNKCVWRFCGILNIFIPGLGLIISASIAKEKGLICEGFVQLLLFWLLVPWILAIWCGINLLRCKPVGGDSTEVPNEDEKDLNALEKHDAWESDSDDEEQFAWESYSVVSGDLLELKKKQEKSEKKSRKNRKMKKAQKKAEKKAEKKAKQKAKSSKKNGADQSAELLKLAKKMKKLETRMKILESKNPRAGTKKLGTKKLSTKKLGTKKTSLISKTSVLPAEADLETSGPSYPSHHSPRPMDRSDAGLPTVITMFEKTEPTTGFRLPSPPAKRSRPKKR